MSTETKMPEPVAWITDESFYGLKTGRTNSKGAVPVHASRSYVAKTPLITTDQAEAYAAAKAQEALLAAKELADWAEHEVGADPELTPGLQAIRALIPPLPGPAIEPKDTP